MFISDKTLLPADWIFTNAPCNTHLTHKPHTRTHTPHTCTHTHSNEVNENINMHMMILIRIISSCNEPPLLSLLFVTFVVTNSCQGNRWTTSGLGLLIRANTLTVCGLCCQCWLLVDVTLTSDSSEEWWWIFSSSPCLKCEVSSSSVSMIQWANLIRLSCSRK